MTMKILEKDTFLPITLLVFQDFLSDILGQI